MLTHTSTERLNGKYVTLDLQCAMESAEARCCSHALLYRVWAPCGMLGHSRDVVLAGLCCRCVKLRVAVCIA